MIFASDLDRTLIYSDRFLAAYEGETETIEHIDDKPISHMSKRSIQLLDAVNRRMLFIPTTTRSMEQYKRISVFQQQIRPKYAIVANGGMILVNNKPDPVWNGIIAEKMSGLMLPQQLIHENAWFFGDDNIKLAKSCDELFAYAVYHNRPECTKALDRLHAICANEGYTVTLNGRKAYIIPSFMTKWAAVSHIMELEGETTVLAAGDSMLDAPLIANSTYSIIPLHGELSGHLDTALLGKGKPQLTFGSGLHASDELLAHILAYTGKSA